jgi:transposase
VENVGGLGRHLAGRLAAAGESVVDVPPKLSARVRVLSSGNARKNDELDALATALAASHNERLAAVGPEAASEVLRLLSERREDLVAERTRALNRLHGLLRDLVPGGVAGTLSAHRAARILRSIRPQGASAHLRRCLASEILRDIRTLERKIADLERRIEAEVEASGTTLTEICRHRSHPGREDHRDGRQRGAFPHQGPFRLLRWHGAGGGHKRRCGTPQALAGRQPQAQLRPAHGRHLPGQV